jgi:Zn-dependent protease
VYILSVLARFVNNLLGWYTSDMLNDLPLSDLVIVIVSIIGSMAIHEAMHGFTAHWLGDTTAQEAGRLTLNPLKHIDVFTTILLPVVLIVLHMPPFFIARPVPFRPDRLKHGEFGAALVGLAGPFTNFALAVIAALVLRFGTIADGTQLFNAIFLFIEVNLGFFVFNMIPLPPLDGSRLLYAVAPEPLQRVMFQIESMGFIPLVIFMLIIFPFVSPSIGSIETSILQFLLR